jgi:hypothetical protein
LLEGQAICTKIFDTNWGAKSGIFDAKCTQNGPLTSLHRQGPESRASPAGVPRSDGNAETLANRTRRQRPGRHNRKSP